MRDLVKMSINLINFNYTSFFIMHYIIKWYIISMYLLQSWKMGCSVIVDLLSTYIFFGLFCGKLSSFNKFLSQIAWHTHDIVEKNSFSQVKSITINSLFEVQVNVEPPIKTQSHGFSFNHPSLYPDHYHYI